MSTEMASIPDDDDDKPRQVVQNRDSEKDGGRKLIRRFRLSGGMLL
jgi:hypothetical protein